MSLDALTLALRKGSQAKAGLAGLDEDYSRALDLSTESNFNKIDQYGNVGTLGLIGDMIGQSQGRKKLRELAPQREAARTSIADNENALGLYQAKLAQNKVLQDQTNVENKASALTQAAALAAEAKAGARNAPEAWVNPDGSGVINGFNTDAGFVDGDGNPVNIENKIPYEHYAQSIRDAKKGSGKGDSVDPMAMAAKPMLLTQILGSEFLEPATGVLDPERYAGAFGYGDKGDDIQPLHMKMDDVALDTMKANLEGLGAKPTDKDMEVAFRSVPDKNSQPYTWAVWARDMYMPMFEKAANRGIEAGTFTQEQKLARTQELQTTIAAAINRYSPDGAQQPAPQAGMRYPDDPEKQARFDAYKAKQGL